jgi:hypothetical protein
MNRIRKEEGANGGEIKTQKEMEDGKWKMEKEKG